MIRRQKARRFGGSPTGDSVPSNDDVQSALSALGFERRTGRHWMLPGQKIAVELPGDFLSEHERAVEVEMPTGQAALVISLEDALVQRLHEFVATGDFAATSQAMAMLQSPRLDTERLAARATQEGLTEALAWIRRLSERASAGEVLEMDDVHRAATEALRKRRPYS